MKKQSLSEEIHCKSSELENYIFAKKVKSTNKRVLERLKERDIPCLDLISVSVAKRLNKRIFKKIDKIFKEEYGDELI